VHEITAAESLQDLLILPPPVPLEDRDIDDLRIEEARELLRRQKVRLFS